MIIKGIRLENIRSYLNEEINFPESSILLSGDVGSGKSSVLLAIDFALFGLTRGVLSGNALLRNGSDFGSVELHLEINGKDIVIKRSLKRNNDSVVQDLGHILIDDVKQDLSVVELKAKVLELLNYPKDLLTKSKSLIYRFTVYTPQEEMKIILTEDSETRLEILRRVFDIDKYRIIRENCITIIKKLKEHVREGEILSAGLDEKKAEKKKLEDEVIIYKGQISDLSYKIDEISKNIDLSKKSLQEYEFKIKSLNEVKNKLVLVINNKDYVTNEKLKIEEELNEVENEIKQDEKLLDKFDENFEKDARKKIDDLQKEISEKEEKINKIVSKQAEFNFIIRNSQNIVNRINELDKCPTCFQVVTEDHKHNISSLENEKLEQAQKNINIFNQNHKTISEELYQLKKTLDKLHEELNEYMVFKIKIENLRDKRDIRYKCKSELNRIFDSLAKLNEQEKTMESEIEISKNIEKEHIRIKYEFDGLIDERREVEIIKAGMDERIKGIEKTIINLSRDITEKLRAKEKKEKLGILVKWLYEQFLEITEKMERSVMLRLHNDFDSLFQKWVNMLIDNENLIVKLDSEFTPIIVQDGYDIEYDFLSGGEKTAIALAYRLGLNQVINNLMSSIETKDLIILDEPTDGFSSEQLDSVRIVLDELNMRQIIIVSHDEKIESFVNKVLRFEKIGHVSRILK